MRLGLFEQAAGLEAGINAREQAALEGDRIALGIRYGRIDARTLTGTERYRRLDSALASKRRWRLHFNPIVSRIRKKGGG